MKRIIALVLAISLGGAALASDYKKIDPATTDAITATLTEQGYEVRRVKKDDGLYEAYAVKDGVKYEIYLNEKFELVRTKIDD